MKLTVSACLLLWNCIVSHLAKAGEPEMEITRQFKVTITQGKTVILPCIVSFANVDDDDRLKYSVFWTNHKRTVITMNQIVQGDHRKYLLSHPYPNEWNLKIIRVRSSDSGEYRCQVNSDPVQTKTVTLVVHVPPRISSPESVEVKESDQLVVYCNVTGDPTPTVSWYKDNKKLEEHSSEMLVIEKAARNDSGIYRCKAENGIQPADIEDITVDVLYAPTVHMSTNEISQFRYKAIVLDCKVIANPKETVTWYKNGNPLRSNWKYKLENYEQSGGSQTHSLTINYLERLDFGDYVCLAVNKVGTASQVVTVTEISTTTMIEKLERTTPVNDKGQDKTTRTTTLKSSSGRMTLSSTSRNVLDNTPRDGELVEVPDNASKSLCCKNSCVFIILALAYLFV